MSERRALTRRGRWRARFLRALADTGNLTQACVKANISKATVRKYRREDPEFATDYDDAVDEAADKLEQEARRRAVDGVIKPVFYMGERVDNNEVVEYSDSLLMFLLKAARPEKYRENYKISHDGQVDHEHEHRHLLLSKMLSDENALELANSLERRLAMHSRGDGEQAG